MPRLAAGASAAPRWNAQSCQVAGNLADSRTMTTTGSRSAVVIQPLSGDEFLALAGAMLRDHWAEAGDPDLPLQLDELRYRALENSGSLIILGAFLEDGTLVGYSVNLLSTHLQSCEALILRNEGIYVEPFYRQRGVGTELRRATRTEARGLGADRLFWHVPADSVAAKMFERRCQRVEIAFSEKLED